MMSWVNNYITIDDVANQQICVTVYTHAHI